MRKKDLIVLRDKMLSEYYSELMTATNKLRTEALPVPQKTSQRLAIGGKCIGEDNYNLVIRVQNKAGRAMDQTRQIVEHVKKKYGDNEHVDVAVVRRIITPSQKSVVQYGSRRVYNKSKIRPLEIGNSIGHRDGPPGTLGLFVAAKDGVGILSCNHVIARTNEAQVKDWIYQPGPPDSPASTDNRIARLAHFRELTRTGSNYFDAAYCILEDDIDFTENQIPLKSRASDAGGKISNYIDPFDLKTDKPIAKIGRTTDYTSEPIDNVSVGINDVVIEIPGFGNHRFDDMIEIEWSSKKHPFAEPGDSGSVLYQEKYLSAFGIHVASGEIERKIKGRNRIIAVSYACPINKILDSYKLSLL